MRFEKLASNQRARSCGDVEANGRDLASSIEGELKSIGVQTAGAATFRTFPQAPSGLLVVKGEGPRARSYSGQLIAILTRLPGDSHGRGNARAAAVDPYRLS